MSLASRRQAEVVSLTDDLIVVMTKTAVTLPAAARRECTAPELVLLERLAQRDRGALGTDIEAVARSAHVSPETLFSFVDELTALGLVDEVGASQRRPRTYEPPGPRPSRHERDPSRQLALPVPLAFRLGPDGFDEHDHEGAVRVRLSAVELSAAAVLRKAATRETAFKRQRAELGDLALDLATFSSLIDRLLDAELLRAFDPDDLGFHGPNRARAAVALQQRGRQLVSAAIARVSSDLDAIEAERRERLGTRRTKVLPVCGQSTIWRLPPLALGMIFTYAKAYKDGVLEEYYDFRPDWLIDEAKIDAYSEEPGVYLFSSYIWCSERNLVLSARAKEKHPWNLTIHGGPDTPKYEGDVRAFFAAHPHVDVVARGEGEVTTAHVLEALAPHIGNGPVDLSVLGDVPGIYYRDGDDVVCTPDRERLVELDVIPSPYLTGLFDSYAEGWRELSDERGDDHDRFALGLPGVVLETNRGCPYGCTFCDWGSATLSRIRQFSLDRVFAELEWCAQNHVDAVGLADANFGILARDVDITKRVAELKMAHGNPKHFGTNYAKNSVKHLRQIVETLAEADILSYGLLSLQSMDADTLKVINRSNIKLEKYEQLAAEFRRAHLPLYVDLMLGLPGQTVRSFTTDLQECVDREVHAKIFPTILLVNSPMNEPSYRERHGITARPGEKVVESATFSRDNWEEMMMLRQIFFVFEKYGVLRHVARHVRQTCGMLEVDFFKQLLEIARTEPRRFPVIRFAVEDMFMYMLPPVSWDLLLDEVREVVTTRLGVPDDDALSTALQVQKALLPSRGRQFPDKHELKHDYVAWHEAMLDAKYDGHLDDWPTVIPPLRSFPPGVLSVEDPRNVCLYGTGFHIEGNPWDAWELESPVSRAVSAQA
jgi:hypothetical protein